MNLPPSPTYDVRIWGIRRYKGARRTTYILRWQVAGKRFQRTLASLKLAEAFRAELLVAARAGDPFDADLGLPTPMQAPAPQRTWMQHAMQYAAVKWPAASARHRRGMAEALTDITLALIPEDQHSIDEGLLRRALYTWAFNAAARADPPPDELADAARWLDRRSPLLGDVADPQRLRAVLDRLALRQDRTAAAASTVARKRATLHNVLEYAVELGFLQTNPLQRVKWKAPRTTETVDRRVVVNPAQARALLNAVWQRDPAVAAFFGCLYYAGLRPAEARALRLDDCRLPDAGWGRLLLARSHQTSGTAWTDNGRPQEERALKHRGSRDTRVVPAHPELVAMLRRHLDHFEPGTQGRLFVARTTRRGVPLPPPYANPVAMGTVYRAWHRARATALTQKQAESMLARRPYDLRHACLSTWLNAGVPPARVAEWAGHGVDVLLRVYAKCVEGDDQIAMQRIEAALAGGTRPQDAGSG